jgi:hypothetical protein
MLPRPMTSLAFHAFLLSDEPRLSRFRRALEATVGPGDVVVDIGAGVGILSFQALQAGAEHAYAIESGDSIAIAKSAATANGFGDRMTFVKARSTAVELPQRGDLAVFDVFESFGLNQGLLGVAKDAAQRLLKPTATLVPRAIDLYLAPVDSAADYERTVGVWSRPADGFDYAFVRANAVNSLHPTTLDRGALLAEPAQLAHRELNAETDVAVDGRPVFTAARAGTLHGFTGWFEAELAEGIWVTNAPEEGSTLYARAFLPFEEPVPVEAGDRIEAAVSSFDGGAWRWRATVRGSDGAVRRAFDHSTLFSVADQRDL